ncbi:alpha/beta fold hydrolase [Amycolatopsis sp. NPDC047767]|uniref:alpha/beta fold hydrolase n=1 Tax=Amycolatopsis sp. NPDC047767 TaxID=3156765 RepID=UPI003456B096
MTTDSSDSPAPTSVGIQARPLTPAVELHHRIEGDPAADVPVVLIHGVGSSLASWDDVVGLWPAGRPVVRYDLRGHGQSPAPAGPWNIDDFAADHVELLKRLGIGKAHTVGFSLGGLIAQRVAAVHPELVDTLVVIGAVAGRTDQETNAVQQRLRMVVEEGPAGAARKSVERWYSKEYLAEHPEVAAETVARMAQLDAVAYTHAYRVLATTDLADQLPRIMAPVLAMTGEHDAGSPPRMSRLIAERTHGRCVVLSGARHTVLQERPDEIAKEIELHVR